MASSLRGSGPGPHDRHHQGGGGRGGDRELKLAFRRTIPAGESDFSVDVPRQLALDHEFSFGSLHLVPGYFSEQAGRFLMDQKEELAQVPKFLKIGFAASDLVDKDLFKNCTFRNPSNLVERSDWVTEFNKFFGRNKPPHLLSQAVFFDWVHAEHLEWTGAQLNLFAQKFAEFLYGEEETAETVESGHLPTENVTFDLDQHLNRAKFPAARFGQPELVEDLFKNLRLRLFLAPFTALICTSNNQLNELGFDTDQMGGARSYHKRFYVINKEAEWVNYVAARVCADEIKTAVKKPGANGANLNPIFYTGFPLDPKRTVLDRVDLKEWQWRSNEALADAVQEHIRGLSYSLNLNFRLRYSPHTETFTLMYPEGLKNCEFVFSADLSERMGFPAKESVLRTDASRPVPESEDVPELLNRCLALSWDTGIVVCTPAIESSANALMNPENNLAQLVPDGSGTIKLDPLPGPPSSFRPDALRYGSGSTAPVSFRLHRFIDDNLLLPLHWPVPAFVLGALRATPVCR